MKRIIALFLTIALLVPCCAVAEEAYLAGLVERQKEQGLVHLWDIPFGIGVEQFKTLMKMKTGFEMEERTDENGKVAYCSMVNIENDDAAPRVSGYVVVMIQADFCDYSYDEDRREFVCDNTQPSALKRMSISWRIDDDADNEYTLEMYLDLLTKLKAKYGDYEECKFKTIDRSTDAKSSIIENEGEDELGNIRKAEMLEALNRQDAWTDMWVLWKNAGLMLHRSHSSDLEYSDIDLRFFDKDIAAEKVQQPETDVAPQSNNVEF